MKRLASRLTYANVVATLALFLVVAGGGALAAARLAKGSVGARQIKNEAVSTAKIKNGAVTGAKLAPGAVASVSSAGTAGFASKAGTAETAATAGRAAAADEAANAAALGGTPASGYARAELEPVHLVGEPGQPAFESGCGQGGVSPLGFYRDPFGIVHLFGEFEGCTEGASIFDLPAGFRPAHTELVAIYSGVNTTGTVRMQSSGNVVVFGTKEGSLASITFRAG